MNEINIVPFVDIVLVLLIIFMLTAPMVFDRSIPLQLPSAASGETEPGAEVGITILEDGSLLVNGDRVELSALPGLIRGMANAKALISADRMTRHGEVVRVLDLLREAGIEHYAINVIPAETSP